MIIELLVNNNKNNTMIFKLLVNNNNSKVQSSYKQCLITTLESSIDLSRSQGRRSVVSFLFVLESTHDHSIAATMSGDFKKQSPNTEP